jgi:hypothetical protein
MSLDESNGIQISKTRDWRVRFNNWQGGHNNLRVCRCLKSLGELGLGRYMKPLLMFLTQEIIDGNLKGCSSSLVDFWIPTLPKKERAEVLELFHSKRKTVKKQKFVPSKACLEPTLKKKKDNEGDDDEDDEDEFRFDQTPTPNGRDPSRDFK